MKQTSQTTATTNPISNYSNIIQQQDPEFYYSFIFTSPAQQKAIFVLRAFNLTIANISYQADNQQAALLRFQWWIELINNQEQWFPELKDNTLPHDLKKYIDYKIIHKNIITKIIHARKKEIEQNRFTSNSQFLQYIDKSSGALFLQIICILNNNININKITNIRISILLGRCWALSSIFSNIEAYHKKQINIIPEQLLLKYNMYSQADLFVAKQNHNKKLLYIHINNDYNKYKKLLIPLIKRNKSLTSLLSILNFSDYKMSQIVTQIINNNFAQHQLLQQFYFPKRFLILNTFKSVLYHIIGKIYMK